MFEECMVEVAPAALVVAQVRVLAPAKQPEAGRHSRHGVGLNEPDLAQRDLGSIELVREALLPFASNIRRDSAFHREIGQPVSLPLELLDSSREPNRVGYGLAALLS
jgi:hypothetical protein